MAAGALIPSFRPKIGSFLATVAGSGPVKKAIQHIGTMPGPGGPTRQLLQKNYRAYLGGPHQDAADFLVQMLENKAGRMIRGGALYGGIGGAMAGVPAGALTAAYGAGKRLRGPMERG
jgi:hypothetical protein